MSAPASPARCDRCGRTVWLRAVGTSTRFGPAEVPPGTQIWQWAARKGTKPRPIECTVSDGYPMTYHEVDKTISFYGDPAAPLRVTRREDDR